jgi:hypothetical protein
MFVVLTGQQCVDLATLVGGEAATVSCRRLLALPVHEHIHVERDRENSEREREGGGKRIDVLLLKKLSEVSVPKKLYRSNVGIICRTALLQRDVC